MKLIALTPLFAVSMAATSSAQSAQPKLQDALQEGRTVWITDSSGREEKGRIVSVGADTIAVLDGGGVRHLATASITRVRARYSDSILNGALIGAGAAIGSGLFFCSLTETWENCRDDAGPMFRVGALGAGIGIGIDALIRGRRTIYEAAPRLSASPLLARGSGGVRLTFRF